MGPAQERAERRALIALLAVFALLVQALWPAAAVAAPDFGAAAMVCTGHGLAAAPDGGSAPDKRTGGHPCQHCVCPSLAVTPPPLAAAPAGEVSYTDAVALDPPAQDLAPGRGLAAPPPPGRGPPVR